MVMVSALPSKSARSSALPSCTRTTANVLVLLLSAFLKASGTAMTIFIFFAVSCISVRSASASLYRSIFRYCPTVKPFNACATASLSEVLTVFPASCTSRTILILVPFCTCCFSSSVRSISFNSSAGVEMSVAGAFAPGFTSGVTLPWASPPVLSL